MCPRSRGGCAGPSGPSGVWAPRHATSPRTRPRAWLFSSRALRGGGPQRAPGRATDAGLLKLPPQLRHLPNEERSFEAPTDRVTGRTELSESVL